MPRDPELLEQRDEIVDRGLALSGRPGREQNEPGMPRAPQPRVEVVARPGRRALQARLDRKSTRLNSSHSQISYAVFCLKKKKIIKSIHTTTFRTQLSK